MEEHGLQWGLRRPTAEERARATGVGPYLVTLNLTDRPMYDAQGNSFHPMVVAIRALGPID
eukprot:8507615-Alexandrium_andersonii.AAC.1